MYFLKQSHTLKISEVGTN